MKIISVKQPWASLIVNGLKDIENRDWKTHHRGPVLIHASQRMDDEATDEMLRRNYGTGRPRSMPQGGVIGMVDVVDCVDHHPSKWFSGKYGFVLRNPRRLKFTRWPGQLGVREVPRALLAKLQPERRPHQ